MEDEVARDRRDPELRLFPPFIQLDLAARTVLLGSLASVDGDIDSLNSAIASSIEDSYKKGLPHLNAAGRCPKLVIRLRYEQPSRSSHQLSVLEDIEAQLNDLVGWFEIDTSPKLGWYSGSWELSNYMTSFGRWLCKHTDHGSVMEHKFDAVILPWPTLFGVSNYEIDDPPTLKDNIYQNLELFHAITHFFYLLQDEPQPQPRDLVCLFHAPTSLRNINKEKKSVGLITVAPNFNVRAVKATLTSPASPEGDYIVDMEFGKVIPFASAHSNRTWTHEVEAWDRATAKLFCQLVTVPDSAAPEHESESVQNQQQAQA
ncbi:hypothetical protein F4810DRAFT_694573 [Camillea tinctor]|nr:hypothetical protein F4810DRAFT_694573 [Camillea tinctor]